MSFGGDDWVPCWEVRVEVGVNFAQIRYSCSGYVFSVRRRKVDGVGGRIYNGCGQ